MNFICDNISINEEGHICFAGQDVCILAEKYGTPLYLMDEGKIRSNCRMYRDTFAEGLEDNFRMLYASKAASFKQIYRIIQEEKMGIDVVSSGEINTALKAGFDMSRVYFHSNNKTDEDIRFAMDSKVGFFVADNFEDIDSINKEAERRGTVQKILLRVTPGIDTHTYEAVNTGKVDSKFGIAIETGQAEEAVKKILGLEHLSLEGFHCHVGSMVFHEDVFERTAKVMLEFAADMKTRFGYVTKQLDLGGGFGIRYVESDPPSDVPGRIRELIKAIKDNCLKLGLDIPLILMEPGRGIVADAGMTIYTVGTVKKIPGYKNYVSIDGGMTDNPRYALYGSQYTVYQADAAYAECDMECSLVGRICESDDIIQPDIKLPETIGRGNLVAVCTTGAYNYSMSSNYNRIPRPPVVMLRDGESYVAVRRENIEDVLMYDI